ncbi:MAG: VOC family protein [Bryobacteraceae bacterium]
MAVVEKYSLGTPCWFELGTTDQTAAKQFYSQLLGWSSKDDPMGPDEFYTMFQLNGHDTGAAYTLPARLVAQGVGPHWNVYFAAPDVDLSAARVSGLGGVVVQPPFDVPDAGRMAICQDPGGASFSLWQARRNPGAAVINENNAVCWSELYTRDLAKVREFYTGLFGWETKSSANMPTYIEFSAGGQPRGGMMQMEEEFQGMPSQWGIYFRVEDCDAAVAKVRQLGGLVRHGPFSAPGVGRLAMLADPQGAGFSLITLRPVA